MSGEQYTVELRRFGNTQPWGFRLKGGKEHGIPLFVEQVSPGSLGGSKGIQAGDAVIEICKVNVTDMTHDQAKKEMLRAGNELDLVLQKGAVDPRNPKAAQAAYSQGAGQRVEVVEEPTQSLGGPTYKDVQPKTYKILQDELPASQSGGTTPGARPASIFDRKKKERSGYLQAQGPTIQKAYGEKP